MIVEIKNHLLYIDGKQVEFKKSPNISKGKNSLKYLIQHYTATDSFSSPYNWLVNPASKVSAHLVIGRDGRVAQLAPFDAICWHAGKSSWKNIVGLNEHSIGIESVNAGILGRKGDEYISADKRIVTDYAKGTTPHGVTAVWQKWPEAQVEVIAAVSKALKEHYHLLDILGHEDISPIRKTDPGPLFPWNRIKGDAVVVAKKENFSYKNTAALVNLRSGPGKDYDKITTVNVNTQVKVLDIKDEWTNVEVNGIKGWINSQYLK